MNCHRWTDGVLFKTIYQRFYRFSIWHGWSNLVFLGPFHSKYVKIIVRHFWNFCNFLVINLLQSNEKRKKKHQLNYIWLRAVRHLHPATNIASIIIDRNQSFSWFHIFKHVHFYAYRNICITLIQDQFSVVDTFQCKCAEMYGFWREKRHATNFWFERFFSLIHTQNGISKFESNCR